MIRLEKQPAVPGPAVRIRRSIHLAHTTAEQLLDQARIEADQIRADAQTDAERLRQQARDAGYEEGLTQWNQAVLTAHRDAERLITESEAAVVRLALRVAERILGATLEQDPERILPIVRRALHEVPWGKQMKIRVHPQHYTIARERLGATLSGADHPVDITIVADPSVDPAGCIVESSLGVIDARLPAQLRAIERALLGEAS